MTAPRAWFQHVHEAPMAPEAVRAVQAELDRARREGAPPAPGVRRGIIEDARRAVARLLGADPGAIVLTSGGTEAANLAIKGRARAARGAPRRLITSAVEHTATLYPIRTLERDGFEAVRLPVDGHGRIDPADLEAALAAGGATLVSLQHTNHEVGTLQPVEELARQARRHDAVFHLDAVAAAGLAELDVRRLDVDLLSLSGSRLGAPPGTGALWIRDGLRVAPLVEGGTQEGGLRGGGENLPGLAGLAAAAEAAAGAELRRAQHARGLRDRLEDGLRSRVVDLAVHGPAGDGRAPGHLHVSFPGAEGEALVLRLARLGVDVSTGSACTGEAGKPSHVLEAMGVAAVRSRCSVLFSLGAASRAADVERALEVVPGAVADLRRISAA